MLWCPCKRCGGDEPEHLCLNAQLDADIKRQQQELKQPFMTAIIVILIIALVWILYSELRL